MISKLQTISKNLNSYLIQKEKWNSLLINQFPPVIHRLSFQIDKEHTLFLHKLHKCKSKEIPYLHMLSM